MIREEHEKNEERKEGILMESNQNKQTDSTEREGFASDYVEEMGIYALDEEGSEIDI